MAILGIEQPDVIQIDDTLRLRKYDGNRFFVLIPCKGEIMVSIVLT